MRQIITTSLTLIFFMLAGAVSAGDCLRLCDNEFWRKTLPTLDEVQSELNKGADINGRGFGGQTPLHYAVHLSGRKAENAVALIQAGANVNARDNSGHTPLMLAVKRQNAEVVNILLDAGANAQLRNRRKEIAFDYARGKPEWIDHLSTYKRLKAASGE
jgi:ankyrin repeat protein